MPDPDVSKELGSAATWFLGMMATAILGLSSAVGLQWKHSNKVYGYRLAERDTLKDALNNTANATRDATKAQEDQNEVVKELADAMRALATAYDRVNERLAMQFDHHREHGRDILQRLDDNTKALASMADAVRTNTAMLTEVRNHNLNLKSGIG